MTIAGSLKSGTNGSDELVNLVTSIVALAATGHDVSEPPVGMAWVDMEVQC